MGERAFRVVVVGGGPAGSTAATLLAKTGHDVLVLERQNFPRYHVGESLTPSCFSVLELSGAREKIDAHGFQPKRGGVFRWGSENWVIDWERIFGPHVRSWQVDRAEFDELLLNHAQTEGAKVVQGAHVRAVRYEGERPVAVEWTKKGSTETFVSECDFLIDASGRAGLLSAQHYRDRRQHEIFRNVAIWGYWRGGKTLPENPLGGLNAISAKDGWYWAIPLADDRLSVGFVSHRDRFHERRSAYSSLDEMLLDLVYENETVRSLVEPGEYMPSARVEQDYSYVAEKFCGPGYFLVGDAACFLDPLLATGVHLALYSALTSAACITSITDGKSTEEEAANFFELGYRRAYSRILALVTAMYERGQAKESYFWTAQRLLHEKAGYEADNRAFGEITTGIADLAEATATTSRIDTHLLIEEAERAHEAGTIAAGHGRPDFSPLMGMPNDAGLETPLALVTSPRLGLQMAQVSA